MIHPRCVADNDAPCIIENDFTDCTTPSVILSLCIWKFVTIELALSDKNKSTFSVSFEPLINFINPTLDNVWDLVVLFTKSGSVDEFVVLFNVFISIVPSPYYDE